MSSKGKAAPYHVWLVTSHLIGTYHHAYKKMSEAIRVAKKRTPSFGWSFVTDKDDQQVWASKGFDEAKITAGEILRLRGQHNS